MVLDFTKMNGAGNDFVLIDNRARRIRLSPGQTKEVTLELDEKSLSSYDPSQKKWIIDGDSFEILIGSSSRDIRGKADFRIIPERNL